MQQQQKNEAALAERGTGTPGHLLSVANAALDRATDEVLTNFGDVAETGRWLRALATIEHAEDFAEALASDQRAA